MANEVVVDIVARLDKLESKIDKQASKKGREAGSIFGNSFSSAVGTFVGIGLFKAVNASIAGIKNQISGVVSAATRLETIETQFKTILGSTRAAQKQLKDLQNFAATTPFQLDGLSDATRQLLSFGVAQEDIIPTLKQVGDLAAGVGTSIDQLTIPYGRLISTQKLTLIELDKFADRGINLYGKLSEQTGISLKSIRDDISKGRVPFEEFTKALSDLTSKGGTFFGATQAQSKTLAGTISTLKDNFFNLQATLGETFRPVLVVIIQKITTIVQGLVKSIQDFASSPENIKRVTSSMFEFGDAVVKFGIAPLEAMFNAGNFLFKSFLVGINTLVAGFGKLGGAIGFILEKIGAGGGLTKALNTFSESTGEVLLDSINDLNKTAENGLFNFEFSSKLSEQNENLRAFLDETIAIQAEKNGEIAANNKLATDSIVNSNKEKASSILDFLGSLTVSFTTTEAQLKKTATQINATVKNAIVKGISGGIQTLVSAVAQGKNAIQAFGTFLLSALGDLAIQMGEIFLATGIGMLATKQLDPSGAIAAGIGLIALGSIVKAIGGGGGSPTAGAAGTPGNTAQVAEPNTIEAEPNEIEERGPSNQIIVQGSIVDPQGILDAVNQISEENGAVFSGVSFA